MKKKYAATKVVIDGDIYGNLSYVDSVCIVDTLEQGKEKLNEMFNDFVKECFGDNYTFEDGEMEEIIEHYKSAECSFEENETEDSYWFTFIDDESNNPYSLLFSVTSID